MQLYVFIYAFNEGWIFIFFISNKISRNKRFNTIYARWEADVYECMSSPIRCWRIWVSYQGLTWICLQNKVEKDRWARVPWIVKRGIGLFDLYVTLVLITGSWILDEGLVITFAVLGKNEPCSSVMAFFKINPISSLVYLQL